MKKKIVLFGMVVMLPVWMHGAILVNNLANTQDTIATANTLNYQAQQFTTDTGTYRISQITVHANKLGGVTPIVEIYTDSAGEPGSMVAGADFDTSPITTTIGDRVLTPNNNIDLSPSTSYWIVARADNFDLRWMRTQVTTFTSDVSGTFGEAKFSTDSGTSWNDYTSPDFRFLARIEVNAIPEPEHFVLLLGVIVLLYLYLRKKYGYAYGSSR